MILAELIKDRVTVPMLLEQYGVKIARGGRCACPIHHGKDLNMTVKPKWFRCFRCGASGTVIDLYMALAGCTFNEAIDQLDGLFALGLKASKPSEHAAARLALTQHRVDKRRREARRQHNDHQYTLLCHLRRWAELHGAEVRCLDSILDHYLSYTGDDMLPDAFTLAADAGLKHEMEVMMLAADALADSADGR